mmetsp:Transcript_39054/g.121743  ORF Transcript_39054/g.121743 Transcript_39054/m.121743 type:complete len:424 (-) Transcript_39054:319-1590(-)
MSSHCLGSGANPRRPTAVLARGLLRPRGPLRGRGRWRTSARTARASCFPPRPPSTGSAAPRLRGRPAAAAPRSSRPRRSSRSPRAPPWPVRRARCGASRPACARRWCGPGGAGGGSRAAATWTRASPSGPSATTASSACAVAVSSTRPTRSCGCPRWRSGRWRARAWTARTAPPAPTATPRRPTGLRRASNDTAPSSRRSGTRGSETTSSPGFSGCCHTSCWSHRATASPPCGARWRPAGVPSRRTCGPRPWWCRAASPRRTPRPSSPRAGRGWRRCRRPRRPRMVPAPPPPRPRSLPGPGTPRGGLSLRALDPPWRRRGSHRCCCGCHGAWAGSAGRPCVPFTRPTSRGGHTPMPWASTATRTSTTSWSSPRVRAARRRSWRRWTSTWPSPATTTWTQPRPLERGSASTPGRVSCASSRRWA